MPDSPAGTSDSCREGKFRWLRRAATSVRSSPVVTRVVYWSRRVASSRAFVLTNAVALAAVLALAIPGALIYHHYAGIIDDRLAGGAFNGSVSIYAAPLVLSVGDQIPEDDFRAELRDAGYAQPAGSSPLKGRRTWRSMPGYIEVSTGDARPAAIRFEKDKITRISVSGQDVKQISLGSPLMTTLSAQSSGDAEKGPLNQQRLIVSFDAIPPVLVHAIVSAEDKRFFRHNGLDLRRIVKAAYVDARDHRKEQGASTLTMQLVRGLLLEPDKLWMRKVAEAMMTVHLEHEWSKQKIFETYVNQVYLGRQAAYSIHGFAEGSRLYFGKALREITLPEAALLAGLVQRPSYFNPFRFPDRAKERRDIVLRLMRENNYITEAAYQSALHTPVKVASDSLQQAHAPWFLDLVNSELQNRDSDEEDIRAVSTTVDLGLQRAAEEAIASGMQEVDKLLAKRKETRGKHAEAALIALDPHTGAIKAIVGGRDYSRSQLNRVRAMRPPGSVFKPFVYAAALNTALSGSENIYTPATTLDDTPTTFWFNGQAYEPNNFRGEVFGTLTLREALAHSDNVAAVKLAQGVGYKAVVQLAQRAGLNSGIQATPAVALGSYDVTPLEMAGAYTVFANGGTWVEPHAIAGFRDGTGTATSEPVASHAALDPRVDWLMVSMLEEVMRSGTAAGVRARGFALPAAGKTGTAHDGWFAGFTSQLLAVVWVGFDDYSELNLEGAKSALPVWTEFMKRAARLAAYRDAKAFPMPKGIESAEICEESGMLATDHCPDTRPEFFIAGSEPPRCNLHQPNGPILSEVSNGAQPAASRVSTAGTLNALSQ